jgi:hypothetical protein
MAARIVKTIKCRPAAPHRSAPGVARNFLPARNARGAVRWASVPGSLSPTAALRDAGLLPAPRNARLAKPRERLESGAAGCTWGWNSDNSRFVAATLAGNSTCRPPPALMTLKVFGKHGRGRRQEARFAATARKASTMKAIGRGRPQLIPAA